MQTIIAGTDRTSDILRNSIKINDELQEKPNMLTFDCKGNKPSEYDDIKVFESFKITAVDATTITLKYPKITNDMTGIFRVGGTITIDINEATEYEKEITVISENSDGNIVLTVMTAGADGTVGKYAGVKVFAGNVIQIKDKNIELLQNIEYSITCLDYTRLFDKILVNDTYEDKTSRYIINDFCNTFINKNQVIDSMDYADSASLQAEWTESGDGNNPTVDTSDQLEGTSRGSFSWTFSAGTATFTASPVSADVSGYVGVASGTPTKGVFGFWYECNDYTKVTSFEIRLGSSASDYIKWTITPSDDEPNFEDLKFTEGTVVGTPDWTVVDYLQIIITETATSAIKFDGFRILENQFFRHFPYVSTSAEFDDFRAAKVKPTEVMQRMADELAWYWYIDYDRYIHLFPEVVNNAPFNLNEDSDNFSDLSITYDTSRLTNRQFIEGGDQTSDSIYPQVVEGDSIVNEWIMKNKFKNLEVLLDDGSVTDTAEVGTDTTTVNATAHGLLVDDYIVNRTRSNAVRKVLTVPSPDSFTVATVTGQTNGDTFNTFIAQVVGVEGLDAEAGNNYMSNFMEKSIRGAEGNPILQSGEFLLFRYNEVTPILVKRKANSSIANMVSVLGYTDGIFDGQPIVDKTLKSRAEAVAVADAVLNKYSNVVITAKFLTTVHGLRTGQLITIKDTTSSTRNINQQFLIQKVVQKEFESAESIFTITCSSLLFGMIELLQQLLRQGRRLEVDEDAQIQNIEDADETFLITDAVISSVGGEVQTETLVLAGVAVDLVQTPPHKWQPSGTNPMVWNRFEWY